MEILIGVCVALFIMIFGIAAVYVIQTLIQLKRTARSYELLGEKLNQEMDKIQSVTNATVNAAENIMNTWKKSSFLVGLLKAFFEFQGRSDKRKGDDD